MNGPPRDFHETAHRYNAGKLAFNIMHFGRLLRAAGLPVGPAHLVTAVETVETTGVLRKDDMFWALHAAFVKRREEEDLFAEAFELFWRDPFGGPDAMSLLLPRNTVPQDEKKKPNTSRRLMEAWRRPQPPKPQNAPPPPPEETMDAAMSWSDVETLRTRDFDQMSADEIRKAQRLIRRMRFAHFAVPTRRLKADERGPRLDIRRMLRASLRSGGRDIPLRTRGPAERPPPLVTLCDISGSMERYSRMFLHFLHALTGDRDRVTSFVFGTRLTNITRWLKARDVDHALGKIGQEVTDWSGGTRIEACLDDFNHRWNRRVLSQGAVVLLVTDGLDRASSLSEALADAGARPHESPLGRQVERIHKSCRRLVWLNPLLRYDGFEPEAYGVKAILPHVDEFRPVHDLASLQGLIAAMEAPPPKRRAARHPSAKV